MNPVFSRIIIKSEQIILVLFQIFHSLLIFYYEGLYELVIGFQCVLPCVCHVHIPNHQGRLFLNTFWHLVQDVCCFMKPAPLNFHLPQISSTAFWNPSAPSQIASLGAFVSPRNFRSKRTSRPDIDIFLSPQIPPFSLLKFLLPVLSQSDYRCWRKSL